MLRHPADSALEGRAPPRSHPSDSALQDVKHPTASQTWTWSGLLRLRFIIPQFSHMVLWLTVSECYCYWSIVIDGDWTCINKSWMNSIITCIDSLLFLGAGITCRAGGHIGGLVLSVPKAQVRGPEPGHRLTYRKNCIVRCLLMATMQRKSELSH